MKINHNLIKSHLPTDICATFLDTSNAFDKVWHQGLLFELKSYVLEDNVFRLLENYLDN